MGTYLSTTASIIDRHDAESQRHHSTKMILHMMWYEWHPKMLRSFDIVRANNLKTYGSKQYCSNTVKSIKAKLQPPCTAQPPWHRPRTDTRPQHLIGAARAVAASLGVWPASLQLYPPRILATTVEPTSSTSPQFKADPHHRFVATHHYGLHSFIHTKTHVFWSCEFPNPDQ